jgi:short-subunit dehydrogenase
LNEATLLASNRYCVLNKGKKAASVFAALRPGKSIHQIAGSFCKALDQKIEQGTYTGIASELERRGIQVDLLVNNAGLVTRIAAMATKSMCLH